MGYVFCKIGSLGACCSFSPLGCSGVLHVDVAAWFPSKKFTRSQRSKSWRKSSQTDFEVNFSTQNMLITCKSFKSERSHTHTLQHTPEQANIEPGLYSWRGAVGGRLMEAGRQAFREESVCSTVWQSQPPSISIIHIHMPLGREQLLWEWPGRGGGVGMGAEEEGVCQTPVMLLFPGSCSSSAYTCVNHWQRKRSSQRRDMISIHSLLSVTSLYQHFWLISFSSSYR